MQDVANNHNATALQGLRHRMLGGEMARQGVEIEQPLAGMAVQPITTVEHNRAFPGSLKVLRQLLRHTRGTMPHHQHISPHGDVGARRIQNALPFAERAAGGAKALHIGGQALGGQLEAAAGSRAGLKEQRGHKSSLQGGQPAGTGRWQRTETLGQFQHGGEVFPGEGREIKNVAMMPTAHLPS